MSILQDEMKQLLREIDKAATKAVWKDIVGSIESDPTAKSFYAEADDWRLLVLSFDVEPQGFPKGTRGYDGTATRMDPPLIMRLTRELAEKFYKAAEAQAMTTSTKRFTMRDEKNNVVHGLENVEEGNALLLRISYLDRPLVTMEVGETAHGSNPDRTERYFITRTA